MKILFLGNNNNTFTIGCLQHLLALREKHEILVGVYSPVRGSLIGNLKRRLKRYGILKTARKILQVLFVKIFLPQKKDTLVVRSVWQLLQASGVNGFFVGNLRDEESLTPVRTFQPDVIIVAGFSIILKAPVLSIPGKGCINLHPSLLPKYRGPEPFYWVLKNQEKETGITIHYMVEKIDAGDIIQQASFPIRPDDDESSLMEKSIPLAGKLLRNVIQQIESDTIDRRPQNEADASYYSFPRSDQGNESGSSL